MRDARRLGDGGGSGGAVRLQMAEFGLGRGFLLPSHMVGKDADSMSFKIKTTVRIGYVSCAVHVDVDNRT